ALGVAQARQREKVILALLAVLAVVPVATAGHQRRVGHRHPSRSAPNSAFHPASSSRSVSASNSETRLVMDWIDRTGMLPTSRSVGGSPVPPCFCQLFLSITSWL